MALNVTLWKAVQVAMQSALGSPKTITAITTASTGVASSTTHGFNDGDYVLLSVTGMRQVDGRIVRVDNKTADTFELEGVDTTLYDTFTAGTAELITFGTTIDSALNMNAGGGNFDFVDITTIHMNAKSQIPGLPNALTYTFDNIWDAANAGEIAMKTASDSQAKRAFKFTFANGQIFLFSGYVGFTGSPTGNAQDKVQSPAVITVFGSPTQYSS